MGETGTAGSPPHHRHVVARRRRHRPLPHQPQRDAHHASPRRRTCPNRASGVADHSRGSTTGTGIDVVAGEAPGRAPASCAMPGRRSPMWCRRTGTARWPGRCSTFRTTRATTTVPGLRSARLTWPPNWSSALGDESRVRSLSPVVLDDDTGKPTLVDALAGVTCALRPPPRRTAWSAAAGYDLPRRPPARRRSRRSPRRRRGRRDCSC